MSFVVFQSPVKVKQFFWDVKDRRAAERGIGGYYNNDTTAVSTTSATRVNLKTYTFTSSAKTNKIRVRVYAYVSGAVSGSSIYLNINGTDVAGPVTVTETSATLKIDYIGDIPSSTSMTVKVDGVAESGYTLYVSKVYIIAGFGLTSTTSVNILSITLDPNNDVYKLSVNGNFYYEIGLRYWVKGNRKTTASATITSSLANEIQGSYSPSASDDGDNNAFITVRTGDYASSFTISGYVGASGDVIIITGIYCQIVIRGYTYDRNIYIKEKGVMFVSSRHVSIDGASLGVNLSYYMPGTREDVYISSGGADVKVIGTFPVYGDDNSYYVWNLQNGFDTIGNQIFLHVNIVVVSM